jgi:signal transduction histidine kinase
LPQEAVDYLQQITQATGRMNRLVQDLLNYSRLSRMEIKASAVRLVTTIEEARGQLEEVLRDKVTVSVDASLMVSAHPPTLTQSLLNLISNGLKFHAPGKTPHVELSANRDKQNVILSVRDEGIGIAPEHQERIFNVFERLHTADAYPGTGIGLAIVRRGISRMGGSIRVESAPGKGSTFYLSLPAA